MAGPERSEPFGVSEQHERLEAEARAMQGGDPPAPASGGRYRVEQRGDGLYDVISASGNVTIGGLDTPEEARQRLDEQQARDDRRRMPPPPTPVPTAPPPVPPPRPARRAGGPSAAAAATAFTGLGSIGLGSAFKHRAAQARFGMGAAASAFSGLPNAVGGIASASPPGLPPLPPGWGAAPTQYQATPGTVPGPAGSGHANTATPPTPPSLQPSGPASVPGGLSRVAAGLGQLVAALKRAAQGGAPGSPFGAGTPGVRPPNFAQGIAQGIAAAFKHGVPGGAAGGMPPGFMTQAQVQAAGTRTRRGRRHARATAAAATARFTARAAAYRKARQAGVPRGAARGFAAAMGTRPGSGVAAGVAAYRGGAGAAGVARAFAGGIGGGAGAALGAAAGLAVGFAAAIPAFAAMVERMRAFSEEVVASNRSLSRWNGAIGSAYMELGVHDFHRSRQLGLATQGSAITAVRAVDSMRDNWQGVDILGAGLRNRGAGFASAFAGGVGADLSHLSNLATVGLDRVDPNGLVSGGVGAGLYAGIRGTAIGTYDAFLNNPLASILNPVGAFVSGLISGQKAAAAAADAKVVQLAGGATVENPWGVQLNAWAARGPILKRPAPRP